MMKRFHLALRAILGRPHFLATDGGTLFADADCASDADFSKAPPFDLVFCDIVALAPPRVVIGDGAFRVYVFADKQATCDECGGPLLWLVLELRTGARRYHLLSMHESHLAEMTAVLAQVTDYLVSPTSRRPAPYWRQKRYTNHPRDLSNCPTPGDFLAGYSVLTENCFDVLRPGGRLAVLMGVYTDREAGYVPLTYHTKRFAFRLGLRQCCTDIIRFSHGASNSHKTYRSSFIPGLHDTGTVFERAR